mgnify:CR=1 FL=1
MATELCTSPSPSSYSPARRSGLVAAAKGAGIGSDRSCATAGRACRLALDDRSVKQASAGSGGQWVGSVAGAIVVLCVWVGSLPAQQPGAHWLHQGVMPPGAIGSQHLLRGGCLPGYFQPVQISVPEGAAVALAADGTLGQAQAAPLRVGLLIGQVYRLSVFNVPFQPGLEVFPTIEVIDRLYAPRGQERRFAIPIELTQQDLEYALSGKFVTRVIYLEDPQNALPARQTNEQNWFDVAPGQDPLLAADALGRPVAILRLGARVPTESERSSAEFLFGSPPWISYPAAAPYEVPVTEPTTAVSSAGQSMASDQPVRQWHDPRMRGTEGLWR